MSDNTSSKGYGINADLRISFSPKYLPILAAFMAKNDIRYYLNGVLVEKAPQGGVFLVATNGHQLIAIHDKDGSIEGQNQAVLSISAGLITSAKKCGDGTSSMYGKYKVLVSGARIMVAADLDGYTELFIQPGKCIVEGNFPKWRTVIPDFAKLKRGCMEFNDMNAVYLKPLSVLAERGFAAISAWQQEDDKGAFVFQIHKMPEAIIVTMPFRPDMKQSDGTLEKAMSVLRQEETAA